jgi:hypothetical protein
VRDVGEVVGLEVGEEGWRGRVEVWHGVVCGRGRREV